MKECIQEADVSIVKVLSALAENAFQFRSSFLSLTCIDIHLQEAIITLVKFSKVETQVSNAFKAIILLKFWQIINK